MAATKCTRTDDVTEGIRMSPPPSHSVVQAATRDHSDAASHRRESQTAGQVLLQGSGEGGGGGGWGGGEGGGGEPSERHLQQGSAETQGEF